MVHLINAFLRRFYNSVFSTQKASPNSKFVLEKTTKPFVEGGIEALYSYVVTFFELILK